MVFSDPGPSFSFGYYCYTATAVVRQNICVKHLRKRNVTEPREEHRGIGMLASIDYSFRNRQFYNRAAFDPL